MDLRVQWMQQVVAISLATDSNHVNQRFEAWLKKTMTVPIAASVEPEQPQPPVPNPPSPSTNENDVKDTVTDVAPLEIVAPAEIRPATRTCTHLQLLTEFLDETSTGPGSSLKWPRALIVQSSTGLQLILQTIVEDLPDNDLKAVYFCRRDPTTAVPLKLSAGCFNQKFP
jgi:hypothetical protein